MSYALRIAQDHWDHMTPPEDEPEFLETSAGQNWLTDAAEGLVQGHDQKAGAELLVSTAQLHRACSAMVLQRIATDDEDWLGQMVVALADLNVGLASRCMKQLLGPTNNPRGAVNELAEELLAPHAEKAAEALRQAELEDCP